jgi:hypothetical protein
MVVGCRMTPIVHTITLQQPWAWAVIFAGKDVENRSWHPLAPFLMLVHAGRKWDREGAEWMTASGIELPDTFDVGGIIGAVRVTGWQEDSASRWAVPGYWHWNLEGPLAAEQPVACRGRPGFFPPPPGWRKGFRKRLARIVTTAISRTGCSLTQ